MWNKNIETFLECTASFEEAGTVLLGAPFDGTTSYRPGARFGPSAIRHESYGLESYSPYQDRDLLDIAVFDGGDLELPPGDSYRVEAMIETAAAQVVQAGKKLLLLGGEHLVSLGAVKALFAAYPDLHILHFDAHADLRNEYLGVMMSHACVLRRCHDLLGDGRIHQFGIRSGDREEFAFAEVGHTDLQRFTFEGLPEMIRLLRDKPIYLTVDLDVLDPSVFPGTGTPEAGGVTFQELLTACRTVMEEGNVVSADLVELAPGLDMSGVSTAVAGKLVREFLLWMT